MLILLVIVDSDHNHIITTLALHNCPTRRLNKTYMYVGHVIDFVGDQIILYVLGASKPKG
jgi:hypothetical protein